ncbi:MAG TPA: TonB family protein [Opitutaceae bacterium]|nr:TonB family protein [Opitutaceae bacterium]
MTELISIVEVRGARQAAGEESVGLLIGAAFTFTLFFGLAHFENFGTAEPVAEIEELRMVAMPIEPPPPPPKTEEIAPMPEEMLPFSGLEVGATDSPVSVAVVPPDLEMMFPASAIPRARIQFGIVHADLKPRADAEFSVRHVFQVSEVDQRPRSIVRTSPVIPAGVRGNAATLRVGLLLLIDQNGKVESARVTESSGNPQFDSIVADTVIHEWLFTPALRRGKKVRVLAQQPFRVTWSGNKSPFEN